MGYKKEISFCICTYNRNPGLKQLLDSISKIVLPPNLNDLDIELIIIDNFDGRSEEIINQFSNYRFHLKWFHEINKGLAYARNRSVAVAGKTEYCLFVDDDQVMDENCLLELYVTSKKNDATVVYGSNPPIYNQKVSKCLDVFFQPQFKKHQDYPIYAAPTNCTLIKKSVLDQIEGPFNMTFNLTGGEDSFLTRKIFHGGYRIFRSVNAKAMEVVPSQRISLKWITKRHFRCSTSLTIQDRKLNLGIPFYIKRTIKALIKIGIGVVFTPFAILLPSSSKYKFIFWIEAAEGAGHLVGYLNYQPKEYG